MLHPRDCIRDGVSFVMSRWLQISSLDEFSDYLTGDWLEGGPNDVAHGLNLISDYAWQIIARAHF
jgi:hypothetical protein